MSSNANARDSGQASMEDTFVEGVSPLGHLSADQVEDMYQRYLRGEKVSELLITFKIQVKTNALLPLLPPIDRFDLICPHCGANATQKRAARNGQPNRPLCIECAHAFSVYREDICGCCGCLDQYLAYVNGTGQDSRVPYSSLTQREKVVLLAVLTMAPVPGTECFSLTQQERRHHSLAPTSAYQDKCVDNLFNRNIILVSAKTSPEALDFYRKYEAKDHLWWCPNVSAVEPSEAALDILSLRVWITRDLEQNKADLGPVLTTLMYEIALEELIQYVNYRVEQSSLSFKAERAAREVLRPLLASSSVSNIFSFIWKAVKQADQSLERGVFKGATHAGNSIPSAIVRIAEDEKQHEYDRSKGMKICQISVIIYSLILDDPDGSFKIPLPRYTAEVMRPVLEGITNAEQARLVCSWGEL